MITWLAMKVRLKTPTGRWSMTLSVCLSVQLDGVLTKQTIHQAKGNGEENEGNIPIVFRLHDNHANKEEDDSVRCCTAKEEGGHVRKTDRDG